MYEELLEALYYVVDHKNDPQVNMFNIAQIAGDCAAAIEGLNMELTKTTSECAQFRRDSIVLSLMVIGSETKKTMKCGETAGGPAVRRLLR